MLLYSFNQPHYVDDVKKNLSESELSENSSLAGNKMSAMIRRVALRASAVSVSF